MGQLIRNPTQHVVWGIVGRIRQTRTRLGDRSFSVVGPSLWNSLPVALRDRDISLEQFKRLLKTLVCVGLRRIVTGAFCAVYKYSYLFTYLLGRRLVK